MPFDSLMVWQQDLRGPCETESTNCQLLLPSLLLKCDSLRDSSAARAAGNFHRTPMSSPWFQAAGSPESLGFSSTNAVCEILLRMLPDEKENVPRRPPRSQQQRKLPQKQCPLAKSA